MEQRKYWLGFSLVPGIGPKRLAQLQASFGDLGSAWRATEGQLRRAGLEREPTANVIRARALLDLDREMGRIEALGVRLVTLIDDDYPSLLKSVPDAPAVLYLWGELQAIDQRALAVVGTRKASTYGHDAATELARQLALNGITIVSGLAPGIDAAAHRAALSAGGRTLAVLGCGVNVAYPPEHRELAQEIARQGAVISEFPLDTRPDGRNFPRRNRLISGLSLGVLVVEAPEQSGALITASIAAEQGRDVFAVPGNIFSPASGGANRLIQDGAKLVITVGDILDELDLAHIVVETRRQAETIAPANDTEAQLLAALGADPIHVDDLVRTCGMPVSLVTSTLTILELKGLARTAGHMQYCLARN